MADSFNLSCNINVDPDSVGNMYFRGAWQFCPEYKTGDVVKHNEVVYLCVKPHAGKDPAETENSGYWCRLSGGTSDDTETTTFKTLDGGYASTSVPDSYVQSTMSSMIDGGSSNGRVHMPLV